MARYFRWIVWFGGGVFRFSSSFGKVRVEFVSLGACGFGGRALVL